MGVPLRIVDPWPEVRESGMMWRDADHDEAGRECWWIVLPLHTDCGTSGHPSEITWRTTDRASKPPHGQWKVTGTAPLLTVAPSIDVERYVVRDGKSVRAGSYWHGWIRNGEMMAA